ncbi:cytidylyltransferase domain-containing protein [Oceanobacillus alkalisoli]|uniref:cytidylyltransferase domain-containing protein n=1 Tax=Oceanobacillus alkalisoli TaxID=2925113 RepID=UPI001EE40B58|nr:glycosyltransferase family protein [Oceanobacillus alkalisoli]MCG5102597.1 glycosyltransferase family protein [Oceanobacillus alkalisoli]
MKVIAIVQARMGSTRLPGKILKEVNNKPLLEYQIERMTRAETIDEIVIATTTKDTEQPIVDLCEKLKIKHYRGSEEDVLSRYYEAATKYDAEIVLRITSDCPIIDPKVIDEVCNYYINNYEEVDYVANTIERTYPRGMDVSVFSYNLLKEVHENAVEDADREHVTRYIYNRPDRYKLESYKKEKDYSVHRWTVDTKEDLELVTKIIETLYPVNKYFTMEDCIRLLNDNPKWMNINNHVEQKLV